MFADLLVGALRGGGLSVVELDGWRTRNRPGTFTPVGVMLHHDAGRTDDQAIRSAINGRPDLRPPLYHAVIARTGVVYLVAAIGRANHAGTGSGIVLREVRSNIAPAGTARARDLVGDTSGNGWWWGLCLANDGEGERPPATQIEAFVRTAAVFCRLSGWDSRHVITHAEWTRRKPDPSWPGSWRPLVADQLRMMAAAPQPGPAPRLAEIEESAMQVGTVHVGPLDNDGNGWTRYDPGLGRTPVVVAASFVAVPPERDGYPFSRERITPVVSATAVGTEVLVVIQGARPGWVIATTIAVA